MGQRELRDREHLEDVGAERALHRVQVDPREVGLDELLGRVVHEHVDPPERSDVCVDDRVCAAEVLEVEGDGERAPPLALHRGDGVVCILLLLW